MQTLFKRQTTGAGLTCFVGVPTGKSMVPLIINLGVTKPRTRNQVHAFTMHTVLTHVTFATLMDKPIGATMPLAMAAMKKDFGAP